MRDRLLEVVDHDEGLAPETQHLGHIVDDRTKFAVLPPHLEDARENGRHLGRALRLAHVREPDTSSAVRRKSHHVLLGEPNGHSRLADPAGTRDGHEPRTALETLLNRGEVGLPTDEKRRVVTNVRSARP